MSQLSYRQQTATGADINFTIDTFSSDELKVYVDGVLKTAGVHYNINPYNSNSQSTVDWIGTAPSSPSIVRIVRETDVLNQGNTAVEGRATYAAGSSVKADDLNNNQKQVLRSLQEHNDQLIQTYDVEDSAITTAKIKADNITNALIADDQIDSEHYVAGSIDLEHMSANSIDSDQYVDGSIDEVHISNSAVTQNKLANNSVGTPELINGSVNSDKILDGTIVNTDVNASAAIAGTKISPDFGSQNIVTTGTISTGSFTTSGTVDGRDIAADGTKLDTIETNAKDDQTAAEIKTLLQSNKLTASEIATGALDGRYFTETELNNGALDGRYFTETEADARYFNISTGDTIKDGDSFPDNDTTIATTAAINDRIIDLVDDVGGFVPIANETSFPTANPDVNNGAGTLVSIKAIGSTRTPSTGTVTIANGSGSNTVTITGCGSTVLTAGFGVIVETTTTLHTYAFHRLVPKATEVTTVAGISSNITTVANNTSNINAVAADASDIGIVAADGTDIGLVAGSISNVNTTAGSIANVNTTAGSITNVNNVGNNISNVNAVAGNASNINSAVSNASNINSAVSNASNINTVAGSITNVNNVGGSISNVNTVATNISSVNSFANTYRIGNTNPQTSLDVGDLFFNTQSNSLKVYTGSAWVDGVTATGNFAVVTGNTYTGSNVYNDNVKAIIGTGSDGLEIFNNGNHSRLVDNGTGNIEIASDSGINLFNGDFSENIATFTPNGAITLYHDNTKRIETTASGTTVTGGSLTISSTFPTLTLSDIDHNPDWTLYNGNGTFRINQSTDNINCLSITSTDASFDADVKIPFDDHKLKLGAGDDLEIYHNGTSYIDASNGHFYIRNNVASDAGGDLFIQAKSGETSIKCQHDGYVELYYDDSKKLETTSSGVTVSGNAVLTSGGATRHLHLGPSSAGIEYNVNGTTFVKGRSDAYPLAFNTNSLQRMTIASNGNVGIGTNSPTLLGGDGGKVLHIKGANKPEIVLERTTSGTEAKASLRITDNEDLTFRVKDGSGTSYDAMHLLSDTGAVELNHQGSKKFETTADGATISGLLASTGNIQINNDTAKIRLGASQDLELFHDGADSNIYNASGNLRIRAANNLQLETHDNEMHIKCIEDGETQLYYDNSAKIKTKSYGATWEGKLYCLDGTGSSGSYISMGDSNDLQIFHDGNNSFIKDAGTGSLVINTSRLNVANAADTEAILQGYQDGQCELYYDAVKYFETTSTGTKTYGNHIFNGTNNFLQWVKASDLLRSMDGVKATFGNSDDLQIYHTGTTNRIETSGQIQMICNNLSLANAANSESLIQAFQDGAVNLFYDAVKKFETTSSGAKVTGSTFTVQHTGDVDLILNADTDNADETHNPTLQFRQDGSTTSLKLGVEGTAGTTYSNSGGNTPYILTVNSTNLHLGTNNTAKWFINTDGDFKPIDNNSFDIGSASNRVANIYTNDLHLSNEGHSNDVDGTWGDWTIQEGESDLFLKNNRSGKKYKFNLMEVS